MSNDAGNAFEPVVPFGHIQMWIQMHSKYIYIYIDIDHKCSYGFSDKMWHNTHSQNTSIHKSVKYAKYQFCRRHFALESMRNRLPFNKISKQYRTIDTTDKKTTIAFKFYCCLWFRFIRLLFYQCDESEKMLFIYQLFNASCRLQDCRYVMKSWDLLYNILNGFVCRVQWKREYFSIFTWWYDGSKETGIKRYERIFEIQ